jgi:hypothetical protein
LRLPGRDAAVCDMLSAASVAAEYGDLARGLGGTGDQNLWPREIREAAL